MSVRPICYLNAEKSNARAVLEAFVAGSGAELRTKLDYVPDRPAVFYGVDRLTFHLWNDCQLARGDYYYIDNGYWMGRAKGGPYLRITRNRPQHPGAWTTNGKRWATLGLKFSPWRSPRPEGFVLVACQSDWWHERHGERIEDWVRGVRLRLAARTRREIVVRHKPLKGRVEPPLADQLAKAHAVVVHTSVVGADALLAGVPVFTTFPDSCFIRQGHYMLDAIEDPLMSNDREHWAAVLADNQWTLDEIASGVAWRDLNDGR